jgi:hypothetical protein
MASPVDQFSLFDDQPKCVESPPEAQWFIEVTPDDGGEVWYMSGYKSEEDAQFFSRHLMRPGETHRIMEDFFS